MLDVDFPLGALLWQFVEPNILGTLNSEHVHPFGRRLKASLQMTFTLYDSAH